MNPLNQLPIDGALAREVDAECKRLEEKFGGLIFLIVAHDNQKAHIAAECDDKKHPLMFEASRDVPKFLFNTALMLRAYDYFEHKGPRQ